MSGSTSSTFTGSGVFVVFRPPPGFKMPARRGGPRLLMGGSGMSMPRSESSVFTSADDVVSTAGESDNVGGGRLCACNEAGKRCPGSFSNTLAVNGSSPGVCIVCDGSEMSI
jgi:hypothetical protein